MPTILITGANRGIGLELAKAYQRDGWRVLSACRDASAEVAAGTERVQLDLADLNSVRALQQQLAGTAIDILWNNAGIYLDKNKTLATLSDADWLTSFQLNTIAPLRLAQALTENVAASERKVIVFTSSKMASLELHGVGAYAYRSSKVALNMAVRCFAHDTAAQEVTSVLLHPGHVVTDMGGPEGEIGVAESVAGMQQMVSQLNPRTQAEFSAGYFNYDGSRLPW